MIMYVLWSVVMRKLYFGKNYGWMFEINVACVLRGEVVDLEFEFLFY
jgi:hypothetical protein